MFNIGHTKVRLFVTHGGQNSLLQAVYHAVPVLAIPLFGDQFDNVVRAETKGLGLTIKTPHITSEMLSSTVQMLTRDIRYVDAQFNSWQKKLNALQLICATVFVQIHKTLANSENISLTIIFHLLSQPSPISQWQISVVCLSFSLLSSCQFK